MPLVYPFWLLIRHHNDEAVILMVSEKTFFASIELVSVIAWFVVIFGINTTSDISKLLQVIWDNFEISQVVFMPNITYKSCYYLFILLPQKVWIFTCRYFKLSWNTTALSQSNCRNFSCSSITKVMVEVCYLSLHLDIESVSCRLFQRMPRMDMD